MKAILLDDKDENASPDYIYEIARQGLRKLFQLLITYEALHDLELNLDDSVWVDFKSNSVMAF